MGVKNITLRQLFKGQMMAVNCYLGKTINLAQENVLTAFKIPYINQVEFEMRILYYFLFLTI